MHILYNQIVMNKIIIKEQLSQINKEIDIHKNGQVIVQTVDDS